MDNRFFHFLHYLLSLQLYDRWSSMYTITQDMQKNKKLQKLQSREFIRQSKEHKLTITNSRYMKNRIEAKYGLIEFFKTIMTIICMRAKKEDLLYEFFARSEAMLLEIMNNWPNKCDILTNAGDAAIREMEVAFFHAEGKAIDKVEGDANKKGPDGYGTGTSEEASPRHTDKQDEDRFLLQYAYDSGSDADLYQEETELDTTEGNQGEQGADKKQDQQEAELLKTSNMDDELSTKTIISAFADVELAEARALGCPDVDEKREEYEQLPVNALLALGAVCSDYNSSKSHADAVTQPKPDTNVETMEKNEEMIAVAGTSTEIKSVETEGLHAMLLEKKEQVYKVFTAVMFRQFWRYLNILKEWKLEEIDRFIVRKMLNGQLDLSPKSFLMELLPEDFFDEEDDTDSSDDEDLERANPIP